MSKQNDVQSPPRRRGRPKTIPPGQHPNWLCQCPKGPCNRRPPAKQKLCGICSRASDPCSPAHAKHAPARSRAPLKAGRPKKTTRSTRHKLVMWLELDLIAILLQYHDASPKPANTRRYTLSDTLNTVLRKAFSRHPSVQPKE